MYNSKNCMMVIANVDRSDYFDASNRNTMSFMGMLSPASSSVDSVDVKMTSPPLPIYENTSLFSEPVGGEPFLTLIEKPVDKFRFRYKSEMSGTHGSLTGANSDKIRRNTYPTVHLNNFDGLATIRCSIYQIKTDMPHAHRLIIKAGTGEKDDPHETEVSPERGYTAIFQGMGIIHTAKKNLMDEIARKKTRLVKEELRRNGAFRELSQHENAEIHRIAEQESRNINLNMIRLKFEAFSKELINGYQVLTPICDPIFTEGIKNLKSALTGELKIVRMDHVTTSCLGGQEIYILVEKVTKNNIKVRFFECDEEDREIWSAYGSFSQNDVHHQYAIVFKAPPYKDQTIVNAVDVLIELVRPSDGARSEPREFRYKPCDRVGKKRFRCSDSLSSGELPTTIKNVSFGTSLSLSNSMMPLNADFLEDIANIGSTDFNNIYTVLEEDYAEILHVQPPQNLKTDGILNCPIPVSNKMDESRVAPRVVGLLTAFLKTKPGPENAPLGITEIFEKNITPKRNNALHTAILNEQHEHLQYFLVLLSKMKNLKIMDLKNSDGQTALHLSVKVNNNRITQLLITVGSDPNIVDNKGNTALHTAIDYDLAEYSSLIKATNLKIINHDGYAPLHLAIMAIKLENVQLLVKAGADVNFKDRSNNDTALHLAIKEKSKPIIQYLLDNTNVNIDLQNYNNYTPLSLAQIYVNESELCKEIHEIMEAFATKIGIEVYIKTEQDSDSEDNLVIKSEPNSPERMDFEIGEEEFTFLKNHSFTPECVKALHAVLYNTEYVNKLKTDLNFEFMPPVSSKTNITQLLLNYANVHNKSVFDVRKLLLSYGATAAVDVIDKFYGM